MGQCRAASMDIFGISVCWSSSQKHDRQHDWCCSHTYCHAMWTKKMQIFNKNMDCVDTSNRNHSLTPNCRQWFVSNFSPSFGSLFRSWFEYYFRISRIVCPAAWWILYRRPAILWTRPQYSLAIWLACATMPSSRHGILGAVLDAGDATIAPMICTPPLPNRLTINQLTEITIEEKEDK